MKYVSIMSILAAVLLSATPLLTYAASPLNSLQLVSSDDSGNDDDEPVSPDDENGDSDDGSED